jgi:amidase
MPRLNECTATEVVRLVSEGKATAGQVVRDCIERIVAREADVQAWQHFDAAHAVALACAADGRPAGGALRGATFGVKDIIDTCDMPTEYGSPIYRGNQTRNDAACVALGRAAGAVLLGKTVSTEFANLFPGKTRNPHDPARTPGGSSSGSAAAVADRMVHLAIGTQTTASTIRPASFCGVYGYRPTYGEISCSGVRAAAGSIDSVGLFARALEDIALYRDVLVGTDVAPVGAAPAGLRVGFCRTHFWDQLEPGVADLYEQAASRLAASGARVTAVELPAAFLDIEAVHRNISSFEFVRNFTHEMTNHWEQISPMLRGGRLTDGRACTFEQYLAAQESATALRRQMDDVMRDHDVLLTPAAAGEAPVGLQSTGKTAYCTIWTTVHVPALTVPVFKGRNGLPIGAQLIGARHRDRALFAAARRIVGVLDR